jgi:hypothetical protein
MRSFMQLTTAHFYRCKCYTQYFKVEQHTGEVYTISLRIKYTLNLTLKDYRTHTYTP